MSDQDKHPALAIEIPARLPVTPDDWPNYSWPLHPEAAQDKRDIALREFRTGRLGAAMTTTHQQLNRRSASFEAAHAALTPAQFNLLYFRGTYSPEELGNSRFHPSTALRKLCLDDVDPPPEWLGLQGSIEECVADLEIRLREITPETAIGIWLILSFAQAVWLTPADVLHCPWHDPSWIRAAVDSWMPV